MGLVKVFMVLALIYGIGAVVLAGVAVKPQTNARPGKLVKHVEAVSGYEMMNGGGGGCFAVWVYYNQTIGNVAYICQYTNIEPFMCYGVIMVATENNGNRIYAPGSIPDRTCYAMTCMKWFSRLAGEPNGVYMDWERLDPIMRTRLELEGWTFGGGE